MIKKKGLIQATLQAANHYHYYAQQCLQRLVLIKNCRALDLSLAQIGQLLALLGDSTRDCHSVNHLITQHLALLEQKIAQLQQFRHQLTEIHDACGHIGSIQHCAIIKHLEQAEPQYVTGISSHRA